MMIMSIENLPEILKVCGLSSIATYGVIGILKPLIKMTSEKWSTSIIRSLAICCGAAWGFYLGETPESTAAGVCGAALSSVIVAKIKDIIRSKDA